jgi:XTP/dITP diphosphohydrolase
MRTLLLATGNAKKGRELADICGGRFHVVTLGDVGLSDLVVVEDAPDFAGNALKKAKAAAAALPADANVDVVVADDSGLCVEALDGHPGVRSARFSSDAGYAPAGVSVDAANNRLLLVMLAAVPAGRRQAHFHCSVAGLDRRTGDVFAAQGRVDGAIALDEMGGGGFGYDPLFVVDDAGAEALRGKRMAELSAAEKHGISHRGRALQVLLAQLTGGAR